MAPLLVTLSMALSLSIASIQGASISAPSLRDSSIVSSSPPFYLDSPSSAWTASESSLGLNIVANVPGDVITDLQRGNIIGDPWFESNFLDNRTLYSNNLSWTYQTSVILPPPNTAVGATLLLVFEGIKMGARVSFNGVALGNVSNQHVRYIFPIPSLSVVAGGANVIEVAFDSSIPLAGRFMACSGGWDWAPESLLTLNDTDFGEEKTFSLGIWKSVYVASVSPSSVALTAIVPLVKYLGAYPVGALVDGAHAGFAVNVTTHVWAPQSGAQGTLSLSNSWGGGSPSTSLVSLPAGDSAITLTLNATASQILLWWPNGLGAQALFNLSATWTDSGTVASTATISRRLGFRVAALVTVNDTDATVVAESEGANGSGTFGMFFRINGAAIYARGSNLIPMEELEGRLDAVAHAILVDSAADANMNMMRVWGGGIFPPDIFYDKCDERGILLYHDMQFANNHDNFPVLLSAAGNVSILAEISHQIRRLSHHPAIILYAGNNEFMVESTGPSSVYSTFILTAVAAEDPSRILWPNSPSVGWRSGVDRLFGLPNGEPLISIGGGHIWQAGNENHGPYTAGVGADKWSTVEIDPWNQDHTFNPDLPLGLTPALTGVDIHSVFFSEFGSASMSSFESMSGTLAPSSWGLHGGEAPSNCTRSVGGVFTMNCTGHNAMAQRNWACDSLIWSYFGAALLNSTGEVNFKASLFQCMIASALNLQTNMEAHRGSNIPGTLIWQLNEVWPTGGWGSIEYGSAVSPGSLKGGRWKPLHYWLKNHVFADVMSACGIAKNKNFTCYVNNARADRAFSGTLTLTAVDLATGVAVEWASMPVAVSAGPIATTWVSPVNKFIPNATTTILIAQLTDSNTSAVFDEHIVHLTAPVNLLLSHATVVATVAPAPNADGSVDITVSTNAVALFVTLTTAAPGRFTNNAFHLLPGKPRVIQWLPFVDGDAAADYALLVSSVRIEDMSAY